MDKSKKEIKKQCPYCGKVLSEQNGEFAKHLLIEHKQAIRKDFDIFVQILEGDCGELLSDYEDEINDIYSCHEEEIVEGYGGYYIEQAIENIVENAEVEE